jgi:hypothetical protein
MNNERKRLGEWTKAGGKAAAATQHFLKGVQNLSEINSGL